jgi:hypothetical protein
VRAVEQHATNVVCPSGETAQSWAATSCQPTGYRKRPSFSDHSRARPSVWQVSAHSSRGPNAHAAAAEKVSRMWTATRPPETSHQSHCPVLSAGENVLSIGRSGAGQHRPVVAGGGRRELFLLGREVPDPSSPVGAPRQHPRSIRSKRAAEHLIAVHEDLVLFTGLGIPDPGGAVQPGGEHPRTVR